MQLYIRSFLEIHNPWLYTFSTPFLASPLFFEIFSTLLLKIKLSFQQKFREVKFIIDL